MSSVVMKRPDGTIRVYNKGAAEWVVKKCTSMLEPDGSLVDMDAGRVESVMATIHDMASRGFRCICLTYTDYPETDPNR